VDDDPIGQARGDGRGLPIEARRGARVGGYGFGFGDEDGGAIEAVDAGDEVLASGEVAEPPGDSGAPIGVGGGGAGVGGAWDRVSGADDIGPLPPGTIGFGYASGSQSTWNLAGT